MLEPIENTCSRKRTFSPDHAGSVLWELCSIRMSNGTANIVPHYMQFLLNANMLRHQLKNLSSKLLFGVVNVTERSRGKPVTLIVRCDDVISSFSKWNKDMAKLVRAFGEAMNKENCPLLLCGGPALHVMKANLRVRLVQPYLTMHGLQRDLCRRAVHNQTR